MDEYTAEAFVNRDEPIPFIAVSPTEGSTEANAEGRRQKLKRALSPSRLKTKPTDINTTSPEKDEPPPTPSFRTSIQDRLFSSLLRQVVPTDDSEDILSATPVDPRSTVSVTRPAFSLPVMTNNFRRFNARIGIVFVFQNRLIRLFTWRTPTHTLSFLATYTFICLDPHLLIVVPMAIALFYIMIPAFTSRHPPPPPPTIANTSMKDYHQAYTGPALAPATVIKPASETSKDFFRNMRDLQNSMADFSNVHDALVSTITPATNFSDETYSSQLFLYLTILTTLSFITAHLLPWRLIILLGGWAFVVSSHPTAQNYLMKLQKQTEAQTTLALNDPKHKHEKYVPNTGIPLPATPHAIQSAFAKFSQITLSSRPEVREVEIFELQHRPLSSITSPTKIAAEWQPHLFTPHPYDPLSPARIAGDRPRGTRFFEDVEPPEGWEWAGKKWELDLEAGDWVNERLVVGVEYDVLNHDAEDGEEAKPLSAQPASGPGDDGKTKDDGGARLRRISTNRRESINLDFGGWVWDLPPAPGSGVNRDDDLWLAYGDYDVPKVGVKNTSKEEEKARKKKEKEKERAKKEQLVAAAKDWEEATRIENRGRTGEWRRRRWVRLIKRKVTT
ncbi:Peroxisome size and maintenance regulator [Cladophialophora chaetospira]|uniref:Peroxisome size and maintenance regulator n=1 Tax=Cladophialophora chaetospira TaxID=386627 RepID=A0AA39CCF1_9EURO|nr:Peroxisome size and maintenance regulator [Cladophialophora chaetospira]